MISQLEFILKSKGKTQTPLKSPQILILSQISPEKSFLFIILGNISKPIARSIAKKFGLIKVCVQGLIKKEIIRKSIVGDYCKKAILQGEFIPDDVYCTLAQTEIQKTYSQHLGWVMDGFPMTKK